MGRPTLIDLTFRLNGLALQALPESWVANADRFEEWQRR